MESATLTARSRRALWGRSWRSRLRVLAPVGYGSFVLVQTAQGDLPLSKDVLLLWIGGFLLAFTITAPRRFVRGAVLEWLPLAGVLFVYDWLRGAADGMFFEPFTLPQLHVDEWLFGGEVPTIWLQQQLWHGPFDLRVWDWVVWGVYVTHFFATLVLAAVLWIAVQHRFRRFMVMICVLSMAGFATYALFPAVPPWMAAENGHLSTVTRIVPYVWGNVDVFSFDTIFESGKEYANDVAAMPSLHAGFSMLVTMMLCELTRSRWLRAALVPYPLLMGAALVYGGEHYVADVLAGWLYAALTYIGVNALFRRLARRRAARDHAPTPAPTAAPAPRAAHASGSAEAAPRRTSGTARAGGS